MVAPTSHDAYVEHLQTGGVTQQQAMILGALRRFGPMTRHQIASVTGIPLSSVCRRVNELAAIDQIESVGVQTIQGALRRQPREVVGIRPDLIDRLGVPHESV